MLNADEIMSRKFTGKNMKEAYLKACKWYATNVLAEDELQNILVDYEKVYDEQFPTVILHLYASVSADEIKLHHCSICKETHKAFYINEETDCNWCKINGYYERCNQKMELKKHYCKELLGRG
jgi:hypothetical protein